MTYACPGCGKQLDSIKSMGTHVMHGDCSSTPEDRFWGKVGKSSVEGACWLWGGATTTHGYGCAVWKDRVLGAHKIAYMLSKGEVPAGLKVRHSCDTRLCCNPAHLELGTHADNMADMAARGRGQKDGRRVLTAEAVREIRAAHGKESSGQLAKRFGVGQPYIFAIWGGRVWKKVA